MQDLEFGIEDCPLAYRWLKNNPFEEKRVKFEQQGQGTKVLIAGISYHNGGIDTCYMNKKVLILISEVRTCILISI